MLSFVLLCFFHNHCLSSFAGKAKINNSNRCSAGSVVVLVVCCCVLLRIETKGTVNRVVAVVVLRCLLCGGVTPKRSENKGVGGFGCVVVVACCCCFLQSQVTKRPALLWWFCVSFSLSLFFFFVPCLF